MNKQIIFKRKTSLLEVYLTIELLYMEKEYENFLNVFEFNKKKICRLDCLLINNILKWREEIV